MEQETLSAWMRLPRPLQAMYFRNAAREAKKAKKRLEQQAGRMKNLQKHLEFHPLPEDDDEWKTWRIIAVDGSYSPRTSERVGVRQGTYQAGYMLFEGKRFIEEEYWSGTLSDDQMGDPDKTKKILELSCTNLERKIALQLLDKADLIIIDGSFFGFRVRCNEIRNKTLNLEEWKTGADLVDETRDMSLKLLNSGKALGVVKRVRTDALDGWLIYKHGDESHCINRNDRAILSYLMPENSWFAYKSLFGSLDTVIPVTPPIVTPFYVFSRLRARYRYFSRRPKTVSSDYLVKHTRDQVNRDIKKDLNVSSDALAVARYYLKNERYQLPMCIEAHKDVKITRYLSYLKADVHKATGLPYPIDLIDDNVTLPSGFTKEFLEEVESLLIREHSLDPNDLSDYFKSINPQKEE